MRKSSWQAGSGGVEWWGHRLRWHHNINQEGDKQHWLYPLNVQRNHCWSAHPLNVLSCTDPGRSTEPTTAVPVGEEIPVESSLKCPSSIDIMRNLSPSTTHLSAPLPGRLRLFPTVNNHKSCRWYEPVVCIVGTTSNSFKSPSHKAWLTTGMCCILFFKKNKKTSLKGKKKNQKWIKIWDVLQFVLQCSN